MKPGDLVRFQGRFDEAEEIHSRALTSARCDGGDVDPPVRALVLNPLGIDYKDTGRYDAAHAAYGEATKLMTATRGGNDPATASLWHNIAGLAYARGQPHQAAAGAARAADLRERGRSDPTIRSSPKISRSRASPCLTWAVSLRLSDCSVAPWTSSERVIPQTGTRSRSTSATSPPTDGNATMAPARKRCSEKVDDQADDLRRDHPEIARQLNNLAVAVATQDRLDKRVICTGGRTPSPGTRCHKTTS